MKSQRAKDYIFKNLLVVKGFDNIMLAPSDAARAVEIAEEDAAAEKLAQDRKDLEFLKQMKDRLDFHGCFHTHEMLTDWIVELEQKIGSTEK